MKTVVTWGVDAVALAAAEPRPGYLEADLLGSSAGFT